MAVTTNITKKHRSFLGSGGRVVNLPDGVSAKEYIAQAKKGSYVGAVAKQNSVQTEAEKTSTEETTKQI